jgi:IclR family transcriptional regulator, KDG regulon repressor
MLFVMPNSIRNNEQKRVTSVDRAVTILDILSERGELSLSRIAEILNAPKTSVFDILTTLEARRMVSRAGEAGKYALGLHAIEIGYSAVRTFGIRKMVAPVLQALNEQLDETVHLTVLDDDEVLYIDCYESTKRLRTYSVIGVRGPLHCTSVGKAILAWLPEERREGLLKRIRFDVFTPKTITSATALRQDLEESRRRGYTVDDTEHEEGVRCVGVPVFDHNGDVTASISISGPTQRVRSEEVPGLAGAVMEAAGEMSRRLGFRGRDGQDGAGGLNHIYG